MKNLCSKDDEKTPDNNEILKEKYIILSAVTIQIKLFLILIIIIIIIGGKFTIIE